MVDLLFAFGQFLCVIGLLYGLILTIANWKYAGPVECRDDAVIGHEWCQAPPDEKLQFIVVPQQSVTMIKLNPIDSETETQPLLSPIPESGHQPLPTAVEATPAK
jgi:hypothetical protein